MRKKKNVYEQNFQGAILNQTPGAVVGIWSSLLWGEVSMLPLRIPFPCPAGPLEPHNIRHGDDGDQSSSVRADIVPAGEQGAYRNYLIYFWQWDGHYFSHFTDEETEA